MTVDKNTELRKLRPADFYNIALILSPSDNWKKLVSVVTKEGTEDVAKFNGEAIAILEEASRHERRPSAAIFLEEWATMGRKRPTLGLLLDLLLKTELFRAADYLAVEILQIEAPPRPNTGPAVAIDVEGALAEMLARQNLESKTDETDKPDDTHLKHPSDINLQNIYYPIDILNTESSDSDNNCAANDNNIGIIDMEYNQSKSTDLLAQADYTSGVDINDNRKNDFFNVNNDFIGLKAIKNNEPDCENIVTPGFQKKSEISDLIKFSASIESRPVEGHVERSDLIKFESISIAENYDGGKKSIGNSEAMLPNFHILCPKSLKNDNPNDKIDESSDDTKHKDEFLREMSSKELPAILKDFQISNYYNHELTSSELPVFVNNRSGFYSNKSNSFDDDTSVVSESILKSNQERKTDVEKDQTNVESIRSGKEEFHEGHKSQNNVNSCELPVTVLEFQQR